MSLDLNCPLVVLDTETTGTSTKADRVVQIALTKVYPGGKEKEWSTYVNPGISIPPEATAIHGIDDEKVKDSPTFKDLAAVLAAGFRGADFCGFNVSFDLRILKAEFERVGLRPCPINGRIVDAFSIFVEYHPRNLTAAAREYLSEDLEGAHDAVVDMRASWRIVKAQLERHQLSSSVEELHRKYFETPPDGCVDSSGMLRWRHGEAVFVRGKYGDTATPLKNVDHGYLRWIIANDFSEDLKRICRAALNRQYPKRDEPA